MYKYKGVEIIEDAVCADHVHMCVSIVCIRDRY